MPMGCDHRPLDAAGAGHARRAVADPQLAGAGQGARDGRHATSELRKRLSRHARDVERRVPERGRAKHTESTDYYLGTTVDQIAAKQIGRETQLPSLELSMDLLSTRRPVRQRLRLRLPEQPVVVVADDAAALRSASADRLRAPLRRGRQRRRAARRAAEAGPACSTRSATTSRACRTRARAGRPRPGRISIWTPSARSSAGSRRPKRDAADNPAARPRPAGGRAGRLRRPRPADVRPAGAGAPGGRHPRHHVPARARDQQPHLSRDRRARPAPPAHATTATTRRRSRRWPRSTRSTCRCSPSSSRS